MALGGKRGKRGEGRSFFFLSKKRDKFLCGPENENVWWRSRLTDKGPTYLDQWKEHDIQHVELGYGPKQ